MDLAKRTRLNRIFANSSGRLCSIALDHGLGYGTGFPPGLANVPATLAKLMPERPDAVTIMKGLALQAWAPYAGRCPLIVSSICFTPDDALIEKLCRPEEAIRLGADALAVAIGVRGPNEGTFFKFLATNVEEALPLGLPVIAHIYPRDFSGTPKIVHDPENVFWALRVGIECGADIVKIPYTGDPASYRDIIATSPVPVVAAGGPKCDTLEAALELMHGVVASGARGATIGRNIWGHPDPVKALRAFKAIIHEQCTPEKALSN
jgi:class I fructose-bisphosphate aldolase